MTAYHQYGIVPCAYAVPADRRVTIEWRDVDRWAIVDGGLVLASDGQWEVERQPSSRSDDFKARTRYTLANAMDMVVKHFRLEIIG